MNTAHTPTPKLPVTALVALVLVSLAGVAVVRLSGVSASQAEPSPAMAERWLRFEDRADGGIDINDAPSAHRIGEVAPGTNGFLRSAVRGLVRERKRQGVGAQPPFRLVALADGRLVLEDPGTGRQIDLRSFGPANAGVFARLLPGSDSQAHP
ncbi:photosynthetic complex assembly protein PuhC [Ideonella sp. DXS29W]|uniref:Photosynthetic complex assembly protein PuhC n=1 Tax=Ideonella lacteola TaxID=2984193 RepID=A0ABU9BMU2_9BURK